MGNKTKLAAVLGGLLIASSVPAQAVLPTGSWTTDDVKVESQGVPYQVFTVEVNDGDGIYTLAYHDSGWYVNKWPPTRRVSITEIDGTYWFSMDVWDSTLGVWQYGDFQELTPG